MKFLEEDSSKIDFFLNNLSELQEQCKKAYLAQFHHLPKAVIQSDGKSLFYYQSCCTPAELKDLINLIDIVFADEIKNCSKLEKILHKNK